MVGRVEGYGVKEGITFITLTGKNLKKIGKSEKSSLNDQKIFE
jgi:hypothetical protein